MKTLRIAAIRLECLDVDAAADFFCSVFGFQLRGASPRTLMLGGQCIELAGASASPSEPVPANSTAFQHFAIVVSDMDSAMAALGRRAGWSAISRTGPQRLPAASGGVVAFKFRGPDGHPLELLQFPPSATPPEWRRSGGPFLGIDHSAIVVADTARSVAFYQELGFVVAGQQINRGIEQEKLDDVSGAVVEVSTLRLLGSDPPHLELLCYRPRIGPALQAVSTPPVIALVLDVDSNTPGPSTGCGVEEEISDADGHRLIIGAIGR
jgi:catechol 2,3-dioxygenase-like lactoylglutathione lyase family enzyme